MRSTLKILTIFQVWYPRIGARYLSASNSKNGNIASLKSDELEKGIEKDLKSENVSDMFKLLNASCDGALVELNKRTWGSVFYSLNQHAEYEKLDIMKKRTKDLNINCGEGAYTTLVRSYIARELIIKAAGVLYEMKNEGLLRHSRMFFAVITALADKGYQEKAFELFSEMQHHIFKSHKNVSLVLPSNMVVALIRSCIQRGTKETPQIEMRIDDYGKAKDIFKLYNQSGWPLTVDVLEATKDWLNNDPVNEWMVNKCLISTNGLCNSCHQFLDSGQLTSTEIHGLQKNLLDAIHSIFREEKNNKRLCFQKYKEFLKKCGPFDVIIDGMNIGLSTNVKKQTKTFNFDVLYKVANHFVKLDKKVLILVNTSIQKSSLSNNFQFFVTDVGYDDIFIIYACATASLMPFIVTRDKLRDHRFFLDFENRSRYLTWVRSHTLRTGTSQDMLTIHMQHYDPVVQEGKTCWHFPVVGGRWFCAQQV